MRPRLTVLSDELLERILEEAKRVLGTLGMEIRGAEMRRRLLEAGLPLNAAGDRVLFPRDVVERAIATAPKSFWLYDRDGNPHADLGGDRVHFVPGSSGLKWLDHRTGEVRLADSTDFVEYVRLADGLQNIAYLATAFSTNADIEAQVSDAWRLYMTLTNSKKPVVSGAFTEHGVGRMVEMMALFRDDLDDLRARPMSIFTITATGNFRYSEDSCQNLIDCVEAGIPVEIVPVTLMGLIAPVTTVGATVFHTIDVLAGITMAQVIRPGRAGPVRRRAGDLPHEDRRRRRWPPSRRSSSTRRTWRSPRRSTCRASRTWPSPTGRSSTHRPEPRRSARALSRRSPASTASAAQGCSTSCWSSTCPSSSSTTRCARQALRFVREIRVAEDLPVDALIDQLMADQHLIMADHTMAHWPEELYLPSSIVDRDNRENWTKAGGKDTAQRAADEVDRRLARYQPIETDPAIDAELQRIIRSGLESPDRAPGAADRGPSPSPTTDRSGIGASIAAALEPRPADLRTLRGHHSMSVGQELLELGPVDWHIDVHAHPAAMTDVRRPEEPVRRRFDERLLGERRGRDQRARRSS